MNTGNLKIIPDLLHHVSKNDENSYIPVTFLKNAGRTGGKLRPQDKNITRLQEPPLVNNTYFGAIHYDNHLDMKLDYTINTNFQELSLSELETLHHLCELERTQILQSLALAVLTIPYAGYLLSRNRSNFINYEGNILWYYICTKKYHHYMYSKIKDVTKEYPYSTKTKYILSTLFLEEHIFGIHPSHVDLKKATMLYNTLKSLSNTKKVST